jgi:hypothetical protein
MASHNNNGFETSLNKDGHKHFPSMKKNKDYTKIYQTDDDGPQDKKNEIFRFGTQNFFFDNKFFSGVEKIGIVDTGGKEKVTKSDDKKSSPYFLNSLTGSGEVEKVLNIVIPEKLLAEHSQDGSMEDYTLNSGDNSHFDSFGNRSELYKSDNIGKKLILATNGENTSDFVNEEELGMVEASKFGKKVRGSNFNKSESKPINTSHQDCTPGEDKASHDYTVRI